MHYQAAYSYLKQGHAITLPEWGGYWSWNGARQTIIMHTRTGAEIDIRSSKDWDYTQGFMFRQDWELVADVTDTEHYAAKQKAAEPPPMRGGTSYGVLKVDRAISHPICWMCLENHSPALPQRHGGVMTRPTEVFIDCEFNSFRGALITMALVAMDGRELYLAVPLYEPVHPWVAENVVPVLGDVPCCTDRVELALKIGAFLRPYTAVHLVADWPEDIEHFCAALITGPGYRVDTPPLTMEIRRDLDAESAVPHNALHDARAIRDQYLALMTDC